MEGVIETQYQIMQAMNTILTNFKKDGASRKTRERVERKIDLLDKYWAEFQTNHEKIDQHDVGTHPYFAQESYEQTRIFYNKTRDFLVKHLTQEQKPASPVLKSPAFTFEPAPSTSRSTVEPTFTQERGAAGGAGSINQPPLDIKVPELAETEVNSKTEEMLRKQRSNFKAFKRTATSINVDLLKEKWQFEDALKTLESRWKAVDSLYWELDSLSEEVSIQYEMSYNACELTYNEIKAEINSKMWSVSHREKSTPKIEIPAFSGSYQHWTAFKDLFVETIHSNPSLSNAQKMQFLKSKVKGEAEKLIQHLSISSENYETAWEILQHRYNNKKLIFSSHLNSLLSVPITQHLSAASVKKLHDTAKECLNAIKNLGVDTSSWDPILVHLLSQKLDSVTHNDYLESLDEPRELPKISDFLNFLESKFVSWESSRRKPEYVKSSQFEPIQTNKKFHSYKAFSTNQNIKSDFKSHNFNEGSSKCPHCNQEHKLFSCKSFLELQPDAKRKAVAKYNLCKNCLNVHSNKCMSKKRCRVCNSDHNTLLHDAYGQWGGQTSNNKSMQQNTSYNDSANKANSSSNHVSQEDLSETLLTTALIRVQSHDGSQITLRALLDQGSQTSLITEKAAQMLRLPRARCKGVIFGVGVKENNCKGIITIKCNSINGDYTFDTDVFIMRNLINNLPNKSFTKPESWKFLENITLADPEFNLSRPVDILLGAEIYSNIIQEGIIRHEKSQPVAQQTRLGWILCGNVKTFHCNVVINNIEDIQQFWSIEDITENSSMSQDDLDCLQHYKNTTTRNKDGRYVVELPFKTNFQEKLGHSKPMALAQFRQLERKFNRQPQLAEAYCSFIQEYQTLNHMVECTNDTTPSCYLPHHCVQRAESTTTALRVVFNASAKTSTGYTLNDLMKRGPNLQQDLMSLILRWRQYQYAYTADIEKMYRQVLCSAEHQKYQKILWRSSPNQTLREYQLTTISYGMSASPFLAMMTLRQLAADEGHKYQLSRAATALQEEFYMDDLVSGSFSLSSAKQLQHDLIQLLKAGGFNLRKWSSNNEELLQNVSSASSDQTPFDFKQAESTKTLGLKWNPSEDTFSFELKINKFNAAEKYTKRLLLSDISRIFDPLGWLSPITIRLKLLFKKAWLSNTQWDAELPMEISAEWNQIKADLQNISEFRIQRWYQIGERDPIQLLGFCDSSLHKAFACVVYCKVNNCITLVAAKTRLVPNNKKLTLPRLELSAAHLLSKLMHKIKQALPGREIKVFGWSDSTAVLGWIQGDINRWTPFVANRVKQITQVIPPENWYYVKSAENASDCATRGITVEQLKHHHLWWSGPQFLPGFDVTKMADKPTYVTNQEERKTKQSNVTVHQPQSDDVIQYIVQRCSNLTRAVRILAWILRIAQRHTDRTVYLSANELETSRLMIIKHIQKSEFREEISRLQSQSQIHCKSKILCLNPFLDKNNLLRVGGRLKHANIEENMKHPLIIPHSSKVTDLIIDEAHRRTFHAGARMTLAYVRRNYWILGGNRAVKKRLHACIICKKHKATKQEQIMGDLPEPRSNPSRPFHHSGIDFTGFVDVKLNKGRGVKTSKGYIAVFVCMVTKAVHLELVSDLSSSAFLAALKRMSARRGKPHHLYSDNGTNFVGANKLLQQEFAELHKTFNDEFHSEINEMGIQWHFNAPAWPSAGGLWEAAVKSLKHHLRRVVGEQKLTFEEYCTLLTQLEACLNSRPLCTLTEDPDDLNYLTPSHFLSSGPILTILDTERDDRTRWMRTQRIFDDIWKRWQSEYLTQLATRSKWRRPRANIQIDDVVIIHDPNLPAGRWALGRVIDVHPGSDGLVRVVTLKTKSGIIKRPVIKLSVLVPSSQSTTPIDQTENLTNKHNNKTYSKRTPRSGMTSSSVISALIALFFIITSAFGHQQSALPYSLTQIHKALYFDRISSMQFIRDEWKLIVYYDMNPYWEGVATLDKYLKQINSVCEREANKALCDIILLQLRHYYDDLKYYDGMLLNQHFKERTRKQRGLINGVGYVANSLFGILDEHFAEQYKNDIYLIKENENHLALLWKNQTSVVEAEYNLLKRTEESMNRQHKLVNQHLISLAQAFNRNLQEQQVMNELALSAIIATNMLTKLKSIQDTLIDTITDIHHGMFNAHLLSPEQLRDQLSIISGQLSRELSLPIENIHIELPKIYHLLKVKARITEQYFLFEIRIPLISRENYDLYQLTPIPQQQGNTTVTVSVTPISDYVAINLRKDTYLAMTTSDIQRCVQYDEFTRLCHSQKPIFQFKSEDSLCIKDKNTNSCATDITVCRNNWIELSKTNTYLYYCCGQWALRVICGDQITAVHVTKAGVIALNSDCIIKGEDFTVFAHKLPYSELKTAADVDPQQIAPINHVINISVPQIDINITDTQTSLQDIKKQIDQMKQETILNTGISSNDIHQYATIYLLLAAAIVAVAVYLGRGIFRRRRQRSSTLQSETDQPLPVVPPRRVLVAPNGPTPRPRVREEAVELRNFSSLLSSIRRHKKTPPVFTKPESTDSD